MSSEMVQGTDNAWRFDLGDGISLHQTIGTGAGATTATSGGTFYLDGGATTHGPLEIDVHLTPDVLFGGAAHGNQSITITDLGAPANAADPANGLRGPIVVHFYNDLGIPLHKATDGFSTLVIYDGAATDNFDVTNPVNQFHTLYAHFHATSTFAAVFPGFDVTQQTGATGSAGGSPDSSPDWLNVNGNIAAGTHADWGPFTFHVRDQAAADNGYLAFQTLAGAYDPTELANARAAYAAAHPTTPPVTTPPVTTPPATMPSTLTPLDVYRFYNTKTDAHFFTASPSERDIILNTLPDYKYEGVGFKAVPEQPGADPIYRFYNTHTNTHFFTPSVAERDSVIQKLSAIYNYEGVGFYASDKPGAGLVDVHRFYDTANGVHFYTPSDLEKNIIQTTLPVYNYEGVGFYVPDGSSYNLG